MKISRFTSSLNGRIHRCLAIISKQKNMNGLRLVVAVVLCLISFLQLFTQNRPTAYIVSPKREMRGIWVSTVNNIDWPSQPGLSAAQLKREVGAILDNVERMGLNTVFLQVRPASDAIYMSRIEPWSVYLTGRQGVNASSSGFDALHYWIDEAHRRGIELHAWINPFRVSQRVDMECSPLHVSRRHPEWIIAYGGKQYLDPGRPEARAYLLDVTRDILTRYDIDGIHFDDYFYPYPVRDEVFDDSLSFARNNPQHLLLAEWRRGNVDDVIRSVGALVKSVKPWAAFGVSPFGVWRNKDVDARGSDTRAGITNYDVLYANVTKWVEQRWVDYIVPQIYWESGHPAANFDVLSRWWAGLPHRGVHFFVGHAVFKINTGTKSWDNGMEMPAQIEKVRATAGLEGSVFFSYRQFNRDLLGLRAAMTERLYRQRALSPLELRENGATDIEISRLRFKRGKLTWQVDPKDRGRIRFFAIYRYRKGDDFDSSQSVALWDVVPDAEIELPASKSGRQKYVYRVAAIDLYRHEHPLSDKIVVRQ